MFKDGSNELAAKSLYCDWDIVSLERKRFYKEGKSIIGFCDWQQRGLEVKELDNDGCSQDRKSLVVGKIAVCDSCRKRLHLQRRETDSNALLTRFIDDPLIFNRAKYLYN